MKKLRSRVTVEGLDRAPHRAFMRADEPLVQLVVRQVRVFLEGGPDGLLDSPMIVENVRTTLGPERRPRSSDEVVPSVAVDALFVVPFDVARDAALPA